MNLRNRFTSFRNTAANAALVGGMALATPMAALATTGDFDETEVTAKIVEYGGKAVVILAAFILARWALKAMHLVK